jgi:PiT family inorganic phosphate transporter
MAPGEKRMPSVASNVDLNADQDVHSSKPKLDHPINLRSVLAFLAIIALGLGYTAWSIYTDIKATNASVATLLPFILLGVALFVALGFEFVNGFHDTANAVATVIYTHSLPANVAVVWSGFFNFRSTPPTCKRKKPLGEQGVIAE